MKGRSQGGIFFSSPQQKTYKSLSDFNAQATYMNFFGLGPAQRYFTKLFNVWIALLRRVNIRIIIYLDDMLLMGRTLPEIIMARDILIFLLQHLGFVINLKKSVLLPVKQIEFVGLVIDNGKITLAFAEKN